MYKFFVHSLCSVSGIAIIDSLALTKHIDGLILSLEKLRQIDLKWFGHGSQKTPPKPHKPQS